MPKGVRPPWDFINKPPPDKPYYGVLWTTKEIADYLRISDRALLNFERKYGLPIARYKNRLFTSVSLLDQWMLNMSLAQRGIITVDEIRPHKSHDPGATGLVGPGGKSPVGGEPVRRLGAGHADQIGVAPVGEKEPARVFQRNVHSRQAGRVRAADQRQTRYKYEDL